MAANLSDKPKTSETRPWVNFLAYQIAWFACILSAARGMPSLGTLTALGVAAWHLHAAARPAVELKLILSAGAVGLVWESALIQTGWIAYPSGTILAGFAPHWIVALWLVFSITFNVSLKWFKERLALAAVFGLLGGPAAFYAGGALGALDLVRSGPALAAIAVGWSVLMPTMMLLARRWDGITALSNIEDPNDR